MKNISFITPLSRTFAAAAKATKSLFSTPQERMETHLSETLRAILNGQPEQAAEGFENLSNDYKKLERKNATTARALGAAMVDLTHAHSHVFNPKDTLELASDLCRGRRNSHLSWTLGRTLHHLEKRARAHDVNSDARTRTDRVQWETMVAKELRAIMHNAGLKNAYNTDALAQYDPPMPHMRPTESELPAQMTPQAVSALCEKYEHFKRAPMIWTHTKPASPQ